MFCLNFHFHVSCFNFFQQVLFTLSSIIITSEQFKTFSFHVFSQIFRIFFSRLLFFSFCPNLGNIKENTAQKMKFSITDFFSKYERIRSFLRIWSHLLKKSLMENFIFCAVERMIIGR